MIIAKINYTISNAIHGYIKVITDSYNFSFDLFIHENGLYRNEYEILIDSIKYYSYSDE